MANKKISELPETTSIAPGDLVPIVDNSSSETQKATFQKVLDYVTGSTFETITANNYVGIRESMILPNFTLNTFSFTSGGQTVEVGVEKTGISFSAAANRTPTTATLEDNYGSSPIDLSSVWIEPNTSVTFSAIGAFVKNDTNQSVTFTLTAEEGGIESIKTLSTTWTRYFYWGKDANSSLALTEANVKGLGSSALNTSRGRTFTVSSMANEYAYFAYPTSYGALTQLKDNNAGFPTGFTLVGTVSSVSTENGNGNATNYYLYRTSNALNGTISFTTS